MMSHDSVKKSKMKNLQMLIKQMLSMGKAQDDEMELPPDEMAKEVDPEEENYEVEPGHEEASEGEEEGDEDEEDYKKEQRAFMQNKHQGKPTGKTRVFMAAASAGKAAPFKGKK